MAKQFQYLTCLCSLGTKSNTRVVMETFQYLSVWPRKYEQYKGCHGNVIILVCVA